MNKKIFLSAIVGVFLLSGCYTIKIEAPFKQEMFLQPRVDEQPLVKKTKVLYALYGLVPLNPNSTAVIMQKNNLNCEEVSFKYYYGIDDYIINALLNIPPIPTTVYARTLEIRGKTKKETELPVERPRKETEPPVERQISKWPIPRWDIAWFYNFGSMDMPELNSYLRDVFGSSLEKFSKNSSYGIEIEHPFLTDRDFVTLGGLQYFYLESQASGTDNEVFLYKTNLSAVLLSVGAREWLGNYFAYYGKFYAGYGWAGLTVPIPDLHLQSETLQGSNVISKLLMGIQFRPFKWGIIDLNVHYLFATIPELKWNDYTLQAGTRKVADDFSGWGLGLGLRYVF